MTFIISISGWSLKLESFIPKRSNNHSQNTYKYGFYAKRIGNNYTYEFERIILIGFEFHLISHPSAPKMYL